MTIAMQTTPPGSSTQGAGGALAGRRREREESIPSKKDTQSQSGVEGPSSRVET